MSLEEGKLKAFLEYKAKKLESVSTIESKRLEDVKNARETIFKYALPSSIVDGVGGVVGTLITGNFLILLPVILFVIIIYFLANDLDLQKYVERMELMKYTEDSLYELRQQELDLLRGA